MIVYLKGKNGRCDQTEIDVESVKIGRAYIEIDYKKPYKWGIVSGVKYPTDEMEVTSIEVED